MTAVERYLVEQLPELGPFLKEAYIDPVDEPETHQLMAWGVVPYVETLLEREDAAELNRLFGVLDQARHDGHLTIDDIDRVVGPLGDNRPKVWRFLPEDLAWSELQSFSWYPEELNRHVDHSRYAARLAEEIRRLGGLNILTTDALNAVTTRLSAEFRIRHYSR